MQELDKNKKLYILAGVLLIIIFGISTNLIRNNLNSKIDYNSDNVVADLLKSATITYDREVYYILEDIIKKYISSYDTSDILSNDEEQIGYEEYYNILEKTYKSKLSKKEYNEIAQHFFSEVKYTSQSSMDSKTIYIQTNVIRNIYDLGDNRYICAVGLLNADSCGYIGIGLNTYEKTYEIFYLQ